MTPVGFLEVSLDHLALCLTEHCVAAFGNLLDLIVQKVASAHWLSYALTKSKFRNGEGQKHNKKCIRRDLNPRSFELEPKSSALDHSATNAESNEVNKSEHMPQLQILDPINQMRGTSFPTKAAKMK